MHASVLSFASLIILQVQVAPSDSARPLRPPSRIETQWGEPIVAKDKAPLRPSSVAPASVSPADEVSPAPDLREETPSPPATLRVLPFKPPTRLGAPIEDTTPESAPVDVNGKQDAVSRVNYESERTTAAAPLLVKAALTSPEDETWQLPGQPVALYTALERAPERTSRISMVRAYWRMTADVAAYYWSVEEGAFIAGLQASGRGGEQVLLNVARIEAQARLQQAKVTATGSQHDLADLAQISTRDLPPLPRDEPLVGAYQTKFDKIFANRAPPAGIRRVALSIPLQLELIETRAAVVVADTDAVKELNQEHRQGQAPLESVLAAQDRLHRHRVEFLQAVCAYNEMIAEYALAIAGATNNQTIVTMLIRNPATPRTSQAPQRDARGRPVASQYSQGQNPRDVHPPNQYPANQNPQNRYPSNSSAPVTRAATNVAPPSSSGPRTSSRGGTWMAPKTTVRDSAVRGSSAIEDPRRGYTSGEYPTALFPQAGETMEEADSRPALGVPVRELP